MAHSLMAERTPQSQDKYIVRFPEGMRDEIKMSADLNGRSLNAEIIQRLKQSYTPYREDLFTIRLSPETQDALTLDALAHDKTDEERAEEILTRNYNIQSDYTDLLFRYNEQFSRIGDLEERNDALKKQLERDFVLYYTKATQLNNFARAVLNTGTGDEALQKAATDIVSLTEVEMTLLRDRFEDAEFWVSRRDIEIENKRDATNEGREVGDE